jgi:hypothetical protein
MGSDLPKWVLPVAIAIGLIVLGVVAWRAFTGTNVAPGKAVQVRPGMYDFRAEYMKGNIGRRKAGPPPGATP